jgi:membrane-bound lytic murein transglycosylase B
MYGRVFRLVSVSVLGVLVISVGYFAHAQSTNTTDTTGSTIVDSRRAELQRQLDELNAQIDAQKKTLETLNTQHVSLQRDVDILNAQIKQAKLAIKARDLSIQTLTAGITDKQTTIFGLTEQLNKELDSLGGIMRQKNELDNVSLVVAALSADSLSSFFSDLDSFDQIDTQLQKSFDQIRTTKDTTQQEKDDLEAQRQEETRLRQAQQLQEQQIAAQQKEENDILSKTKGQEKAYQSLIAANQKSAAQLRAALFNLTGSVAIPFGKALDYANLAQSKTGIRPAFLLGIIAEESNLGENVGTGSYLVDMNPTRDVPVFQKITASLGLVADVMPVSKKVWYGWGGAMGPAQFIPSTWALYAGYPAPAYNYVSSKDRVGALTGSGPPNPWDPKDAFMASALYLTDSGAGTQTPQAEFKAAMCYLAGCGNSGKKSLQFYGDQVLCLELRYQSDIDTIMGTNEAAAMRANSLYYGQC